MKIAIIDDGVNVEYFSNIEKLSFNLNVNSKNKIVKRIKYNKSEFSHGTTCASIIKKYAPNAEIGSIKVISDETMRGKAKHLITALTWCLEHDIKIIHMSIGSKQIQDVKPIREIIRKLMQKNCIIVSALANTMKFSVPACIEDVFGVKTSSCLKDEDFFISKCGLYDVPFVASSQHTLLDIKGEEYITPQCNSYSAPLITAKIYNIVEQHPKIKIKELQSRFGTIQNMTYEQKLQNTPLIIETINIPVICIVGEKHKTLSATQHLNQIFIDKGYPCKAFTTWKYRGSDDITSIPTSVSLQKLLAFYANKLNLSAILIATDSIGHLNSAPDSSIYLLPEAKYNRYDGDNIYIPHEFNRGKLLRVVKYFEKNN